MTDPGEASRPPSDAALLARKHRDTGGARPRRVRAIRRETRRLGRRFDRIYQALRPQAPGDRPPGSEWLLDNEFLIRSALRRVREGLPPSFWRELPRVAGERGGEPRIRAVARALIEEGWGQLEIEAVVRFLRRYQQVLPLTMGELWALPNVLRMEILSDLAAVAEEALLPDRSVPAGIGIEEAREGREAEDRPIAERVLSLRTLRIQDWKSFFERVSGVEDVLRLDPAGAYRAMDFPTRDRYRKAVERLSRASRRPETEVAAACVRLAEEAAEGDPRRRHVGYYLLDEGRRRLEAEIGARAGAVVRLGRAFRGAAVPAYLLALTGVTACILALLAGALPFDSRLLSGVVLVLAAIPASAVALALVHWAVSFVVPPRILPKMEFAGPIPARFRTLIAIPALLTDPREIDALAAQMETTWLSDPDDAFTVVLLSDLADAPEEETALDKDLLDRMVARIRELNRRHGRAGREPFGLLHRRRRFNPAEGVWMGWERKRGKLEQLLLLIRGEAVPDFAVREGGVRDLRSVRYVITLDGDTLVPRGALRRLVGVMAHPLNRPEFDERGRVRAGYTVMQPRLECLPESAGRSLFSRVFAGDTTLDIYTHAVSEVYQDLFGEGIYAGKGILDAEAFLTSLEGRVPENALLSHDLFEGVHGRAALVDDVYVLEGFPSHYLTWLKRTHRWIRGDWQLLPWLLPRVPLRGGGRAPNPLSLLDRAKIFDNLRRSLEAPSLLLLLASGWILGAAPALTWFLLVTAFVAVPFLLGGLSSLALLLRARLDGRSTVSVPPLASRWQRWALAVVFLPREAVTALDAVLRVLWRLAVSRRHLLQWVPAAAEERSLGRRRGAAALLRAFWPGPGTAAILALLLLSVRPGALPGAAPALVLWLLSPLAAWWISRPEVERPPALTREDELFLRRVARITCHFFERNLGPEDHWLPPDHYQEEPLGVLAHRTSPTNIGLALLSTLSAYDLGYLTALDLSTRVRGTFQTLLRLERYRGHFLNWYDTRDLAPLGPRYVSTVDSGNLAGCLLVLGRALPAIASLPLLGPRPQEGLLDTVAVLESVIEKLDRGPRREATANLRDAVRGIARSIASSASDPASWIVLLRSLADDLAGVLDRRLLEFLETEPEHLDPGCLEELQTWVERLHHHVEIQRRFLDTLAPWIGALADPPALFSSPPEPLRRSWERVRHLGAREVTVGEAADRASAVEVALARLERACLRRHPEAAEWCRRLRTSCLAAHHEGEALRRELAELGDQAEELAREMDFRFLYDGERHLFRIGYDVAKGEPDPNHYDLLASEARLASLAAIAKGDAPETHWLHLGRPYTRAGGRRVLLSWGGTMFEYCMPLLLVKNPPGSLLWESCRNAVRHQIRVARRRGIPWGVSESGFYEFDSRQSYQYRSFGVPGLGLKRDLHRDLVVTPYASALALPVTPGEAVRNLRKLAARGLLGPQGFYEALDLRGPVRVEHPEGAVVRSYMAHHQGMILAAVANLLTGGRHVARFHENRALRAVEHLLHEQIPTWAPLESLAGARKVPSAPAPARRPLVSWEVEVPDHVPHWQILSNGRFSVLLSSTGSGAARYRDRELTSFRADGTLEPTGTWIYLRDEETGDLWSATHEPTREALVEPGCVLSPHEVEFHARRGNLVHRLAVTVSPVHDAELRRLTLINEGDRTRRILVAAAAEPVLAPHAEHHRHPAFSRLFLEASYHAEEGALLFTRRPRSRGEKPLFLGQTLRVNGSRVEHPELETRRERFLGRGGSWRRPAALAGRAPAFGGVERHPLDPVMALGAVVTLPPHARATVLFVTAAAASRAAVLTTLQRCSGTQAAGWTFDRARAQTERLLDWLGLDPAEMRDLSDVFTALVSPLPHLRPPPERLAANVLGQPHLWPFGISGDLPLLLVHAERGEATPLLLSLIRAFVYWRSRGFSFDLVVLDHRGGGYVDPFRDRLLAEVRRRLPQAAPPPGEGLFVLRADQLGEEVKTLLEATARVVLRADGPSLRRQLAPLRRRPPARLAFVPIPGASPVREATPGLPRPRDLRFPNRIGGFTEDGREYVIHLEPGRRTPAPWINVIANPEFGFFVSESGAGTTWSVNSGEHRLSPWSNDPVVDPPGEVLYLRDEETGEVWTPTPSPAPDSGAYQVRHGAGATVFLHRSQGLRQELTLGVARADPVKIIRLELTNLRPRPRRLTATYYVEWVLGPDRELTAAHLVPDFDARAEVLLVRNPWNPEHAARTAFLCSDRPLHGITTDRTEFLGRYGDLSHPLGLFTVGPSGRVEAGPDPCGVVQIHLELGPEETVVCHFLLGDAPGRREAVELAHRYRDSRRAEEALEETRREWEEILGRLTVHTPDPALDLLLNRWLPYQALSCRIRGRTALYQSSGAFGFRDQLQDVLAFLFTAPDIARRQILRAAARQFEEGDVLHWWHPPGAQGVRTRCSDDLLWLPYAVARYVRATGDRSLLDEEVPFLAAPPLEPRETERYGRYEPAPRSATVYAHCLRAIDRASRYGPRGLPRIGSGDWNDGFSRVGVEGRGESVWLGWFLADVLESFAPLAEERGDEERARAFREAARQLARTIEEHAWDGEWYRRAWFDDGTPLGSAENSECRIDAIAQAWAVLSGVADPERARRAMESAASHLVRRRERLVLLLAPPFHRADPDPGYIRGYPPGIRENGGQYTHAAVWLGLAFAALGDGERAVEIFNLLNPVVRGTDQAELRRYAVEPYVYAADIAGVPPHTGRGGWTWYTGSAAWGYRFGIEGILGISLQDGRLHVDPCIPASWEGFRVRLRFGGSVYRIEVENPEGASRGVARLEVDGVPCEEGSVVLVDDGAPHHVKVVMGAALRPVPRSVGDS